MPEYYKDAVVAVEDHRYYNHGAIDLIALGRAVVSNIKQKDFKEGGSTITQQTAKNMYFISEDDVVKRYKAFSCFSNGLMLVANWIYNGFDIDEKTLSLLICSLRIDE